MHRILLFLGSMAISLPTMATLPDSLRLTTDPPGVELGNRAKLTLNGYAQTHYELSNISRDNETNDFQVKRVMLIGNAAVGKHLRAMVMLDVAASRADRRLHEYFMQWNFCDELKLRIGQYKQPFMLENIYIPTILGALNMTEGTRYMAGIYGDPLQTGMVGRDLGLMLTGEALPQKDGRRLLAYSLGIFNGAGLNQRDNNRAKDVIGMVQVFPIKGLQLTTSFILGRGHALSSSPYGDVAAGQNYRRHRWSMGGEWKDKRLYLRSEYTLGWNANVKSRAFYAEAWYTLLPKLDIVANYDHLNRHTGLGKDERHALPTHTISHNYTIGAQFWIWRQCRVATQFVYGHRDVGPDSREWITQFQFAF